MEIDIKKIQKLSKQKEEENWKFRSFLKFCDVSSKRIDKEVHALFNKYSKQINCTECGNCCNEITPVLQNSDINRLASHLNISISEMKKKYVKVDKEGDIVFISKPCPFLSTNMCQVYEARPEDCRSYPHLQKKSFTSRTIQACHNYSICPIVFHVYEDLKLIFNDERNAL